MFSNFTSSTNIRLNAIDPKMEFDTLPALKERLVGFESLEQGGIIVPELIAKGMEVKKGDTVVLVANNKKGSVNGINLKVSGLVERISGPGGRDGYIHIDDAKKVLRIKGCRGKRDSNKAERQLHVKRCDERIKPHFKKDEPERKACIRDTYLGEA